MCHSVYLLIEAEVRRSRGGGDNKKGGLVRGQNPVSAQRLHAGKYRNILLERLQTWSCSCSTAPHSPLHNILYLVLMLICFQISLLLTVVQLEPWLAGGQSDTAIISIKWPSPSCSQHPDISAANRLIGEVVQSRRRTPISH